jgi:hypothetical protein
MPRRATDELNDNGVFGKTEMGLNGEELAFQVFTRTRNSKSKGAQVPIPFFQI